MGAVYHLGAVISVFLAILVLIKKEKLLSDIILGAWLIGAGINLFIYHRINDHEEFYRILIIIYYFVILTQVPLFYLYVHFLTTRRKKIKIKNILHFIPAALFIIYIFFLLLTGNLIKIDLLTSNIVDQVQWQWSVLIVYAVISIPLYIIMAFYNVRQYDKKILDTYSSLEDIELGWLKRCIGGIAFAWLVFIGLELFIRITHYIPEGESLKYAYYLFSIVLFYLGLFGIRKTNFFIENYININNDEAVIGDKHIVSVESPIKSRLVNFPEDMVQQYITSLNSVMEISRPFLKARLTLKDLSDETEIPVNSLSYIINENYNKNFYEFVNDYRVEEFIKCFTEADKSRFTLLAIAMECGFSSKSSFYSIFKKHTGCTPLDYFKELKKQIIEEYK